MPEDGVRLDQAEPQAPMWSTHDPACDQCRSKKQRCERQRPVCSNCKRLNLVCDYSGRGKKPNQNTELIRRLRQAESRINSLETSLSRIQPYLDRIEAESVLFSLPAAGELSSTCTTGLELTQSDSFEWPPSPPEVQQQLSEERGSITCLAVACTKIAVAKYAGNNQTSGPLATLTSSLRQISELQEKLQDGMNMRVTVLRPPLAILQAMAITYFDMLNDSFPMFSRDKIEEHMEHYDESWNDSQDVAYSLCFNNIILLTLMAKVRRHLAQDVPAVIELELLKTFSDNALGAFGSLESLLYPRIANVQALLSLVRPLILWSFCQNLY
ncbi:Zn(II)2Cys6 transcription factor domain-containing protein [Aspergillus clavatus NRRL 1]|uniref:C6 zinc finger domain protein n=1 Tax=Aspergillus clavatus (strain ATCC 1007 / CBS 513.65 / DSM 816 / NCTC 3887 / NRRL 1 / QM 1276 / 107) TaxID=344612 RepID=A1CS79_ASPCL|nr:C6 zinc finger domain protein [Aspergillus clavatus NRRL 1]EAW08500.1 C6 zinc finger domain protein [Aspergillus clavatus NRRL 1]